jgi:hypothetical protein
MPLPTKVPRLHKVAYAARSAHPTGQSAVMTETVSTLIESDTESASVGHKPFGFVLSHSERLYTFIYTRKKRLRSSPHPAPISRTRVCDLDIIQRTIEFRHISTRSIELQLQAVEILNEYRYRTCINQGTNRRRYLCVIGRRPHRWHF